jgi:RNA polymerase primary sigma factor
MKRAKRRTHDQHLDHDRGHGNAHRHAPGRTQRTMTIAAAPSHEPLIVPGSHAVPAGTDGRTRSPVRQLELIRALEDAELVLARHALASPLGIRHLNGLAERLAIGTIDIRDVTRAEADDGATLADTLARLATVRRLAASGARSTNASDARLIRELVHLRLQPGHVTRIIASLEAAAGEERRLRRRTRATAQGETARRHVEAGMSLDDLNQALRAIRGALRDADVTRAKLVDANRQLVTAIARRFLHRGLDLPDLIQEGTIGLLRSIERFERSRGVQFATYATWWIRQAIGRAISRQARAVRLPINVEDAMQAMRRERDRYAGERGRVPTARELAERLDAPIEQIEDLLAVEHTFAHHPISLDEPFALDDGRTHAETLADTSNPTPLDTVVAHGLAAHLEQALASLSPKERKVLRLRYGIGECVDHTLEEIGAQLGVTRQRILQIVSRAIDKIRCSARASGLRSFYEP